MDIYYDDGTDGLVDLRKAARALAASGTISSAEIRKHTVAEITAAALLEIAYSLRPVGAEAADAMRDKYATTGEDDAEPEREPDFLTTGDLVVVRGDDQPGEITSLGYDQDRLYARVLWAESGDVTKVWADLLDRISEHEPPEEIREALVEAVAAVADAALDDDADDFFDTDTSAPPLPEPTSALDELAAKAAKKKGGKS